MSSIAELRAFANMKQRTVCPRCQGYGFKHYSFDKHDKPQGQKCKKCTECTGCDGSGVVMGKLGCVFCSGTFILTKVRGFVHPLSAVRVHPKEENLRCPDCIDCKECDGKGVITRERFLAQSKPLPSPKSPLTPNEESFKIPEIPDLPAEFILKDQKGKLCLKHVSKKYIPRTLESVHPHLLTPALKEALNALVNIQKSSIKDVKKENPCPKCLGSGFVHSSSNKHSGNPDSKCKHCSACNACGGTGTVVGKVACKDCKSKFLLTRVVGFVHLSQERSHDAPENLRCFFCANCTTCGGTGLIGNIEAAIERPKLVK